MRNQDDIETQPLLEPTSQSPTERCILTARENRRMIDAIIVGLVILTIIIVASVLYCVTTPYTKYEGMSKLSINVN